MKNRYWKTQPELENRKKEWLPKVLRAGYMAVFLNQGIGTFITCKKHWRKIFTPNENETKLIFHKLFLRNHSENT